jgi:hypothetical protein
VTTISREGTTYLDRSAGINVFRPDEGVTIPADLLAEVIEELAGLGMCHAGATLPANVIADCRDLAERVEAIVLGVEPEAAA